MGERGEGDESNLLSVLCLHAVLYFSLTNIFVSLSLSPVSFPPASLSARTHCTVTLLKKRQLFQLFSYFLGQLISWFVVDDLEN